MDIVYLTDLRIETIIGVYSWERQIPQLIILDIEMGTDISAAARTDDLQHTVDYKAVSKRIRGLCEEQQFQLVETLAERIAEVLLGEFSLPWVRLRVNKKGAVTGVRDVGVMIERGRRNG